MNLLTKLIDRDGFSLGEPWRLNEKSLIVVVPVLKNRPWGERKYVTAEEAKKDLELTDTGHIDKLGIVNRSGKPVFVRVGSIFEGVGTQSRGAEYSTVLDLERLKVEVAVRCVHASHPISMNAAFHLSSSSSPVDSSFLHHRGQMDTWASVQSSTARYSSMRHVTFQRSGPSSAHLNRHLVTPNYGAVHSDNLVASLNEVPLSVPSSGAVSAAAKDIADLISKIPVDMTSQVGVCVIDLDGVREFEAFDHPDSWTAVAKSIARKYAPEFDTPGKLVFDVKKENIEAAITEFLVRVDKAGMALHHRKAGSAVWVADSDEAVGEYVEFENSGIHVILTRKQKAPEQERARPSASVYFGSTFAPRTHRETPPLVDMTVTADYLGDWTTSNFAQSDFEKRKHHLFVTRSLSPQAETSWGDVRRKVESQEGYSVSPTTISNTLSVGVREGFIRKTSPPGKRKSLYRLTAKGSILLHNKAR